METGTSVPARRANSTNRETHASISEEPLLEWTIATGEPSGVVTMSISRWRLSSAFSRTTMRNTEVPQEMLPLLGATALVATIPVPASPSGGHMGIPGSRAPVGSIRRAPSSVRAPASSPADRTVGRSLARSQGTRRSTRFA